MKVFTKKGITQKIILVVIIATLCNFMFPICSQADIGGILFDPLSTLITTVGDAILAALQGFLYDGNFDTNSAGMLLSSSANLDAVIAKYSDMKFDDSNCTVKTFEEDQFVGNAVDFIVDLYGGETYVIPTIQYSIDNIFAGKIPAFDINFINPKSGTSDTNAKSIAYNISNKVAKWYNAIRNLSIIGLLSVLVYTGIRILISSSADDRAKYKQRIFDWIVAMCLIFFMHYIMLFIITMVDSLNNAIGGIATSIPVCITGGSKDVKFNTNLMGYVRLQVQLNDFTSQVTFTVLYVALLVQTIKFTWVYMKRLITLMFLTIIAPLVAMTYPIDKMNDGKAQAFNAWLKEYIFTALLQPLHLIMYTLLVGTAIEIVKNNLIYGIIVIGFIGQAEKLLRKFFGFDKASTPGALSQAGAALGGAAAWNMIKKGAGFIANKGSGGEGKNGGGNNAVRTKNRDAIENQNAPSGYDAFANKNGQTQNRDTSMSQEQENTSRPQEPENTSNSQELEDWDNNDMYLNPQNYLDESSNETDATEHVEAARENNELTSDESTNGGNNMRSIGQIAKDIALAAPRGIKRSISNSYHRNWAKGRWKRTLGKGVAGVAKFAGRAAVAGTMGLIGLGVGAAGDDLEDVLKYGAAGTALGYATAPSLGRRIASTGVAQSIRSEFGRAIYGSDNAAEQVRQTERLRESGVIRDWAEGAFIGKDGNRPTGAELSELEDRAIEHYNNGFTDTGDIKKVMKLEDKMIKELQSNLPEQNRNDEKEQEKIKERAKEMSETIGKMAKDISPDKLSDQKYVNGKLSEFERGISKANPDLSNAEVKGNANQMMNYVMQYYKKP